MKLVTLAQALVVTAGLGLAPVAAFAQTAPATAPATKPAVTAPATTVAQQTADAACAVHKKESKEFKDCVEKHKAAAKPAAVKDPAKKS